MKRMHLFEFMDFRWFPSAIRNYMTDFLQFISNRFDIYRAVMPLLDQALKQSGGQKIIDMASGGGGGFLKLAGHLHKTNPELEIVLTDYYPNIAALRRTAALSPVFSFEAQSVNAMNVPADLKGLRTQFMSLHHFREEDAVKIIQNAVDSGNPIALLEAQERNLKTLISMLLSPVSVLVTTPFIRPFSLGRIVFTYLIPLVPLFILWDGVVSALRTYSVKEMHELVSRVQGHETYEWKIGRQQSGPASVPYLIGWKK
jgi:hypothetical protein